MKSVHTILSSLLAGMMMFSLAACTASGTGASGSDSSAVQTDAVPQGRGVERQADGISSGLVLGAAPAALADGSLVLKVYYDLNEYKLTFDAKGGESDQTEVTA